VPVVAGEIGESDCAARYIDTLMAWMDAHSLSYLAWAWDTWGCTPGGPSVLVNNYSGTPSAMGQSFHDHLASLAGAPPATLTLSPVAGVFRQTVGATGSNFGPLETVNVSFDNSQLTQVQSTAQGTFTAQFSVPQATFGTHTITAVGQTSHTTASALFTIKPVVALSPNAGLAGSTATLVGIGFAAGETVSAYWIAAGSHLLGTATANAMGTLYGSTALRFTVPNSAPGTYVVYAVGATSHAAAAAIFTVQP
jgi:hypothetical protein